MKKVLFVILWMILPAAALQLNAQDTLPSDAEILNRGIEYYQSFEFEQTLELLADLNLPEAQLFAGKSLYALGRQPEAIFHLEHVRRNSTPDIYHEAGFTLALSLLSMREFGQAFDLLHEIMNQRDIPELNESARAKFDSFNAFLLPEQRLKAVESSEIQDVKESLLMYGVRNSSRDEGERFIREAVRTGFNSSFITTLRRNLTFLIDDVTFQPAMPDGFTFNIGVLLPQQERGNQPYNVSRELYLGLLMAAEEFNVGNNDVHITVHLAEVTSEEDSLETLYHTLAKTHQADVIFGPLFSEDAKKAALLSAEYGIPTIAPLANSDEITGLSDYFFQANPTFKTRGRRMADVAVNIMGYDSLSVLVDRNSAGFQEALAFRQRIEELEREIVHFFDVDFRQRRFNVSELTQHFAGHKSLVEDTTITLKKVDALFLPFTGSASNTMIDIVLTDLFAYRSMVSVIGTEDWGMTDISDDGLSRFNIVYSGIFNRRMDSEDAIVFREEFRTNFGFEPNLFALNGYDNGLFIIDALMDAVNPARLADTIRDKSVFKGTTQNFYYGNTQVNQFIEARLLNRDGHIVID